MMAFLMIFVCIKLVFHVGSLECALKATTIAPENWMVGPMKKYVPFWGGDGTKPPIFRSAELTISFQGMENEHFISYFFLTVVFDSV